MKINDFPGSSEHLGKKGALLMNGKVEFSAYFRSRKSEVHVIKYANNLRTLIPHCTYRQARRKKFSKGRPCCQTVSCLAPKCVHQLSNNNILFNVHHITMENMFISNIINYLYNENYNKIKNKINNVDELET